MSTPQQKARALYGIPSQHPLDGDMEGIKIRAVFRALMLSDGNRTRAASRLGVSIRTVTKYITISEEISRAFPAKKNQWDDDIAYHAKDDGQVSSLKNGGRK